MNQADFNYILLAAIVIIALAAIFLSYRAWKKKREDGKYVIKEEDKLHVTLESKDFAQVAARILDGLGGADNVTEVHADGTRIKTAIKDYDKVDEKKIRAAGVGGVLRPSKTMVQIIVGVHAEEVAEAVRSRLNAVGSER